MSFSHAADADGGVDLKHLSPVNHTEIVDEKESKENRLQPINTASTEPGNLVYNDNDEEPEFHARTWFALAAMFLLNMVQVFALQGPPAVVCARLVSFRLSSLSRLLIQ